MIGPSAGSVPGVCVVPESAGGVAVESRDGIESFPAWVSLGFVPGCAISGLPVYGGKVELSSPQAARANSAAAPKMLIFG